mmetsp:Transcript_11308/g.52524  ORF Transcript_11308/g.52524 Transcript_11308/m.52524 type:complete len:339 (+) Transcript_11308:1968-2984(+)
MANLNSLEQKENEHDEHDGDDDCEADHLVPRRLLALVRLGQLPPRILGPHGCAHDVRLDVVDHLPLFVHQHREVLEDLVHLADLLLNLLDALLSLRDERVVVLHLALVGHELLPPRVQQQRLLLLCARVGLPGLFGVLRGSVGARGRPSGVALGQESALSLRARPLRLLEILQHDVEVFHELLVLRDVRGAPVVVAVGHRLRQALDRQRALLRDAPDALPLLVELAPQLLGVLPRAQRVHRALERGHARGHLEDEPLDLLRLPREVVPLGPAHVHRDLTHGSGVSLTERVSGRLQRLSADLTRPNEGSRATIPPRTRAGAWLDRAVTTCAVVTSVRDA